MALQRAVSLKLLKNIDDGVVNRNEGCAVEVEVLFLAGDNCIATNLISNRTIKRHSTYGCKGERQKRNWNFLLVRHTGYTGSKPVNIVVANRATGREKCPLYNIGNCRVFECTLRFRYPFLTKYGKIILRALRVKIRTLTFPLLPPQVPGIWNCRSFKRDSTRSLQLCPSPSW